MIKTSDKREKNVTIHSEICSENICSPCLGILENE
jgi:hypothetical protein